MVFFIFIRILIEHSVSKLENLIRRRVWQRVIWFCTVCLCPTKRTLGLYGLNKIKLHRKKYNIFWEIITCDPSIYTIDHPDFIVCTFMEFSIGLKRVKFLDLLLVLVVKSKFLLQYRPIKKLLAGNGICCLFYFHKIIFTFSKHSFNESLDFCNRS